MKFIIQTIKMMGYGIVQILQLFLQNETAWPISILISRSILLIQKLITCDKQTMCVLSDVSEQINNSINTFKIVWPQKRIENYKSNYFKLYFVLQGIFIFDIGKHFDWYEKYPISVFKLLRLLYANVGFKSIRILSWWRLIDITSNMF